MDLQERYDELDNIISSLNILLDDIYDNEYIEDLREIKYRAEEELEEIEPLLQAEQDREYNERMNEYYNNVL